MVIAVRSVQNGNGKGLREASKFYNIPVETLDSTGTPGRWGIRTICRYDILAIVTGSVEVGCRPGEDPLSPGEISDRQLAFVSKFNASGKLQHA